MDGNAAKQVLHLKIGAVLGGALLNKLAILNGFSNSEKSKEISSMFQETSIHTLFAMLAFVSFWLAGWLVGT